MLPPLPRCSGWTYSSLVSSCRISLPRKGCRVGLHIVLFEACSAFTRVAACTLARSPIRDPLPEGFRHFVASMPAPVASGWSDSPGGPRTHWKAPPCHGAPPFQSLFALHPVRTWEDTKLLLVHALGHLRDLSRRSFDPALYPSDRQPALDFVRSALRGETN